MGRQLTADPSGQDADGPSRQPAKRRHVVPTTTGVRTRSRAMLESDNNENWKMIRGKKVQPPSSSEDDSQAMHESDDADNWRMIRGRKVQPPSDNRSKHECDDDGKWKSIRGRKMQQSSEEEDGIHTHVPLNRNNTRRSDTDTNWEEIRSTKRANVGGIDASFPIFPSPEGPVEKPSRDIDWSNTRVISKMVPEPRQADENLHRINTMDWRNDRSRVPTEFRDQRVTRRAIARAQISNTPSPLSSIGEGRGYQINPSRRGGPRLHGKGARESYGRGDGPRQRGKYSNSPSPRSSIESSPGRRGGPRTRSGRRGSSRGSPVTRGGLQESPITHGGPRGSPITRGAIRDSPVTRGGFQNIPVLRDEMQDSPVTRGGPRLRGNASSGRGRGSGSALRGKTLKPSSSRGGGSALRGGGVKQRGGKGEEPSLRGSVSKPSAGRGTASVPTRRQIPTTRIITTTYRGAHPGRNFNRRGSSFFHALPRLPPPPRVWPSSVSGLKRLDRPLTGYLPAKARYYQGPGEKRTTETDEEGWAVATADKKPSKAAARQNATRSDRQSRMEGTDGEPATSGYNVLQGESTSEEESDYSSQRSGSQGIEKMRGDNYGPHSHPSYTRKDYEDMTDFADDYEIVKRDGAQERGYSQSQMRRRLVGKGSDHRHAPDAEEKSKERRIVAHTPGVFGEEFHDYEPEAMRPSHPYNYWTPNDLADEGCHGECESADEVEETFDADYHAYLEYKRAMAGRARSMAAKKVKWDDDETDLHQMVASKNKTPWEDSDRQYAAEMAYKEQTGVVDTRTRRLEHDNGTLFHGRGRKRIMDGRHGSGSGSSSKKLTTVRIPVTEYNRFLEWTAQVEYGPNGKSRYNRELSAEGDRGLMFDHFEPNRLRRQGRGGDMSHAAHLH